MALPIMMFDERKLTPSFGYLFNPKWLDPEESIVSILWKLGRMNSLSGLAIAAQISKTTIDPYEGVAASLSEVDTRRLRTALGLKLKQVRGAIIPDRLRNVSSPHFRFCRMCLRRGYHSVVHQLETIHHCPIHGGWLEVQCPHCGEPTPYRLNAHLLDAPFRCGNCRTFYCEHAPYFLSRKPLSKTARATVTRLRMRHYLP